MLIKSTFPEPVLVVNPHNGMTINVAPLFDCIEQMGGESNTPADLKRIVSRVIMVMGMTVHDPQVTSPVALANVNTDLFKLHEMFTQMVY